MHARGYPRRRQYEVLPQLPIRDTCEMSGDIRSDRDTLELHISTTSKYIKAANKTGVYPV